MRTKTIRLPILPQSWNFMTLDQFKKIHKIRGQFKSKESYLANCFLELEGLRPLRYAERWRSILGSIPLIGKLVSENGRQVAEVNGNTGKGGQPIILWKQCYRFKGLRNKLFGCRFFIEDQEILSFQQKLAFLLNPEDISLKSNPVRSKKIGAKIYYSYQTLLSDMPWCDYNRCSMYIQLYSKTNKKTDLEKFLTVLYRAENVKKIRAHFTDLEIRLILLFWDGTQQYFMQSFPHLFKKRKDNLSKDFMKEEASISVFLSKEAYCMPNEAREMRVYDALEYLEMNAVLCETKEREIQKMRRK